MAGNYIQPGEKLTLTAPSGGVISGNAYLIGGLLVIASITAVEDDEFTCSTVGVWTLPKTTGEVWTELQKLYWNDSTKKLTTTATDGALVGVATAAALTGDTTGPVRLNGISSGLSEGPQAAIASFTMGTNITAATANDALTDSSGTNPTEAQFNELAKEVGTKVNAILAALRSAGIIAT